MARILAGLLTLLLLVPLCQAQSPVDAGQLLEQQRRLEEQRAPAAAPRDPLLTGTPSAVPDDPTGGTQITVRQFRLQGNTQLDDAALQAVLEPWLNRPLTLAGLRQAAAAVEQAYRAAGRLAHVSLPAQDVTDGTLRLEIAEARMGDVRLAADHPPPHLADKVEAMLNARLHAGEPLDLDALERALLLADDLPGISVGGSLQASAEPGRTDVLVQIARTPLVQGDVNVDDAANRSTGAERINANLRIDAPFGWGERFDLAASQTRGVSYLHAGASVPVGLAGWRVGLNGSVLRYRVLDAYNTTTGLPPRGQSETAAVEATYPLVLGPRARWNASLSAEQRQQRDQDDTASTGTLEMTSRTRSRSLRIGLSGYAFDDLGAGGQTQASAQAVTGNLSLDGSPDTRLLGDALTDDTQGHYGLLRWSAGRVQTLTPDWALAANLNGQFASRNLDSNEKLYLGGMGAVNAYPSGEAGGSTGQIFNLELRRRLGAHWQASAFYDWGQVQQYRDNTRAGSGGPLVAPNTVTLQGAGVSVAWHGDSGAYVKATYAHRIGSNPLATPSGTDTDGSLHKNRLWLVAGISF